jgi:segregation and condensation protein B
MGRERAEARIEAALYASGRPLNLEELARAGGLSSTRSALRITRRVAHRINSSLLAVEVVELPGERFAMQLKAEYNSVARRFATRPLVPESHLKTLSYVAYFQPITATEVARRRGSQAYRHLKSLEEMGLVTSEKQGRTKVYTTTRLFAEYFGLSPDPQVMKRQLSSLLSAGKP